MRDHDGKCLRILFPHQVYGKNCLVTENTVENLVHVLKVVTKIEEMVNLGFTKMRADVGVFGK